jgi:hypothetical protein
MKTFLLSILLLSTIAQSSFASDGSAFDETVPITDKEKEQAEIYQNQGVITNKYNELCFDEDKNFKIECDAANESPYAQGSNDQKLEAMMPMVTQAYTLITGMAGGMKYVQKKNGGAVLHNEKGTINKNKKGVYVDKKGTEVSASEIKDGDYKKKTKDGQDYCSKIPMVTETAAQFFASTNNAQTEQNIQQTKGSQVQQAAAFYAMAKVHKDRAKAAKIQMGGWGTTSACYATMMATSTITANFGSIAKTAGAVLLTTFYVKKIKAHENRAKLLTEMGDEFPKVGDCNPFTEATCFCNEKTSSVTDPVNFQKFCVPKDYHSPTVDSFICMTQDMKPDPKCDCKTNGTCINAKFASIGAQIGLDPSVMNNPMEGIGPLSSGFGTSGLQAITEKNLAFAKSTLKKQGPTKIPNISLSDKQKKLAKDIAAIGIPKLAAVAFAGSKGTGSLPASLGTGAMSSGDTQSGSSLNKAMAAVKKAKFSSGSTHRGNSSKKRKSAVNPYSRYGQKKVNRGAKGVEILSFAQKAQREAEISKDTSRPIFDIITYRYKATAWKEFKDTILTESATEEKKQ